MIHALEPACIVVFRRYLRFQDTTAKISFWDWSVAYIQAACLRWERLERFASPAYTVPLTSDLFLAFITHVSSHLVGPTFIGGFRDSVTWILWRLQCPPVDLRVSSIQAA